MACAGPSQPHARAGVDKPEGGFVDGSHAAIYAKYRKVIEEIEAAEQPSFSEVVDRHLMQLALHVAPERIRELKAFVEAGFGERRVFAAPPPELEPLIAKCNAGAKGAATSKSEKRQRALDVLIREVDALAASMQDGAEQAETVEALRAEALELLSRRDAPEVFGQLQVCTFTWQYGDPRLVRMKRVGDELLSLAHFGGTFAGGGESQYISTYGDGKIGLLGHAMQGDVSSTALALRDPRLRMNDAKVRIEGIDHRDREKKLIHSSRGFCYLGGVWGYLGELTRLGVRIDPEDGFYYLTGRMQADAGAYAVVVEYPEGEVPEFKRRIAQWQRGDPVRAPIDARDGVCLMTAVSGAFHGASESVFVRIGLDGKWRVGGTSSVYNTAVKALVLEFGD